MNSCRGATATNASVVEEKPGEILFQTTTGLGPNEGLTVAVAFPKGVVAEPSSGSRLADWLADNGPPVVGGAALVGLLAFYVWAWHRVVRDPRAGTVVPIFAPPDELTPAAMRYISNMGSDNRVFAAALVHEPKLLITDEPTVGLDPKSIRLLKDLLRAEANRGTTVFLSTHSLDIAQELADRIGIVERGRLIGCGTLATLRKQASLDGSLEDVFLKLTEEAAAERIAT